MSSRSKRLRSTTPPAVPTMNVSEFVRGGLYDLDQPTTVVSHGTELGTWYPRGQGVATVYNTSSTVPMADGSYNNVMLRGSSTFTADNLSETLAGLTQSVADLHNFLSTHTSEETTTNGEEEDQR